MIVLIRIQRYNIMNTTYDELNTRTAIKKHNIIMYVSAHMTIKIYNFWTHFALMAILNIFTKMYIKIILCIWNRNRIISEYNLIKRVFMNNNF